MISSFRHKGLLDFFAKNDRRGIPTVLSSRIARILDRLDGCTKPEDMNLPGYRFHALKGTRKETYAVSVSGNLRITFRFHHEDAIDVNLEDYH